MKLKTVVISYLLVKGPDLLYNIVNLLLLYLVISTSYSFLVAYTQVGYLEALSVVRSALIYFIFNFILLSLIPSIREFSLMFATYLGIELIDLPKVKEKIYGN